MSNDEVDKIRLSAREAVAGERREFLELAGVHVFRQRNVERRNASVRGVPLHTMPLWVNGKLIVPPPAFFIVGSPSTAAGHHVR